MKKTYVIIAFLLALSVLLVSCGSRMEETTPSDIEKEAQTASGETSQKIDDFTDESKKTNDGFVLTKSGDEASFTFEKNVYTITSSGEYTASGSLDGQIVINAKDCDVTLVLNGVSISSSEVCPILALDA